MSPLILTLALCLAAEPKRAELTVDGVKRDLLVAAPAEKPAGGSPLVFVFHGHGGNMRNAARVFPIHELWPEAVVMYPQGLPTPTRVDPEGKRAGWQNAAGIKDDRDLKLFDALLAAAKERHGADSKRVFVTGHSNGGGFTYLLWHDRHKALRTVAPVAATTYEPSKLKPLSAMHTAGRNDRIARFAIQERTMEAVRKVDHCADKPTDWAPDCLLYPSTSGTPFVSFIHDGGHEVPKAAPELIVRFFKEAGGARPEAGGERD